MEKFARARPSIAVGRTEIFALYREQVTEKPEPLAVYLFRW
jgi:hypothetical protein